MDATWVLGGLIALLLTAWAIGQVRQRRAPSIQLTVRIVAIRIAANEGSGWDSPNCFLVMFCDDAGNERELSVSPSLYPQLAPGQRGILTVRGEQVLSFSSSVRFSSHS
ncbi:MAG: hypothetical protein QM758_28180 [Armatimonas sp.]